MTAEAIAKAAEEKTAIQRTLTDLSGAATAVALVLPEPGALIARLISAALGAASAMISMGATPQQAVDAIKHVRRIDTTEDDARVDLKLEEKRT